MGENYYVNEEYEKAISYFEECIKIKESYDCLNYIGCCYLGLSDYNTAIKIFSSIIAFCPDSERPVFKFRKSLLKVRRL